MILEIDMGNTRLKWRVCHQSRTLAQGAIGIEESLDLLIARIESHRDAINAVSVASVVGGALEQRLADWSIGYLGLLPVFARAGAICGAVRNGYRDPQTLGVDRWLVIVAAYRLVSTSCVVVSFGTAITVDLISLEGKHVGGFIAPGLNLMLDSLTSRTRQIKLDCLDAGSALALEPAVATSAAVHSACAAMVMGLIDNGARQLRVFDQNSEIEIVFTGGDAVKFLSFYPGARLIPDLVLDGLKYVLDYPQQLE